MLKVLIVENREADALLMERELQRGGIDCTCTRVETEALFLATLLAPPDIILCDYSLPALNAPRVLMLLDQHYGRNAPPLIVVTGSIGDEMAVLCVKLGASEFVLKNHLGRLPSAVQAALATRRDARDVEISTLRRELDDCRRLIRSH